MSAYALVEDGAVTYTGKLPKNWKNISGLPMATEAELKSWGWLPYTKTPVTLDKYEKRDTVKYVISSDSVNGVEQKRAMTDDEKSGKDKQIAEQYKHNRQPEYGRVEDQLDMMYHSMDDWKAHCKAVKDKYPKPE